MKPHYLDEQLIKDRQWRIKREADHHRLMRIAQGYRPGLTARFLGRVGGWMIAEGTRLQQQYETSGVGLKRDTRKTEILFS